MAIREPVLAAGEMIVDAWQAGARVSSGAHGIHYPDAISAELVFDLGGVAVDMGPESGKPQGGMSFERGSRNQPPHADGLKALAAGEAPAGQMIGDAVEALIP